MISDDPVEWLNPVWPGMGYFYLIRWNSNTPYDYRLDKLVDGGGPLPTFWLDRASLILGGFSGGDVVCVGEDIPGGLPLSKLANTNQFNRICRCLDLDRASSGLIRVGRISTWDVSGYLPDSESVGEKLIRDFGESLHRCPNPWGDTFQDITKAIRQLA